MPNHVTNELTAARDVIASLATEKQIVDFNTVVSMPKILEENNANLLVQDWADIAMGVAKIYKMTANMQRARSPADAFREGNYGEAADFLRTGEPSGTPTNRSRSRTTASRFRRPGRRRSKCSPPYPRSFRANASNYDGRMKTSAATSAT